MRSAARPPQATIKNPPYCPHATKAVYLLCICPAYTPLIFSTGSKKATNRRCGSGESFNKFSSFYYCVCYAYALYKLLLLQPVACLALLVRSQHILGLYTAYTVCSMHYQSFSRVCQAGRLGIYPIQGVGAIGPYQLILFLL